MHIFYTHILYMHIYKRIYIYIILHNRISSMQTVKIHIRCLQDIASLLVDLATKRNHKRQRNHNAKFELLQQEEIDISVRDINMA